MKEYSERQLLILSNLVYLPASVTNDTIAKMLDKYRDANGNFTEESVAKAGTGGGLNSKDVCKLFQEIDKEISEDSSFGELSSARILNDGNVRAICYTDKNDDRAVVAFRGTGGSQEAWTDNFEGGYEVDTKMQELAADFINNECYQYKQMTVTGHSKGGNLSQYVTVMCSASVDRCVSFDGQGFCSDFINTYSDKVEVATPKIKSIAAYNDYVNILLTPIAGTIMYVQNGSSIVEAHSSLSMLLANEYSKSGDFVSTTSRSLVSSKLKDITDRLIEIIDPADTSDKHMMSKITGSTIAGALSIDSKEAAQKTAVGLMGSVVGAVVKKLLDVERIIVGEEPLSYETIYIEPDKVYICVNELRVIEKRLDSLSARITLVRGDIAYNITSKIYAQKRLDSINDNLLKIKANLDKTSNILEMINRRYIEREKSIVNSITV